MRRVVAYQSQLTKTDSLGVRGLLWSEANPLWSRRPRRNFVVVRTQTQEHCFTEDREEVAPNFLLGRNSIGFSLCLSICPWSNGYPRFNGIDRLVLDTDPSDTTVVRCFAVFSLQSLRLCAGNGCFTRECLAREFRR